MPLEKGENPYYYAANGMQPIDFNELYHLPFSLGNVIKYLIRCNLKDPKVEDQLEVSTKIIYYLNRERNTPIYTWTPPAGMYKEHKKELLRNLVLPAGLHKALYWTLLYIEANKLVEARESLLRYLDMAILNMEEYQKDVKKARGD